MPTLRLAKNQREYYVDGDALWTTEKEADSVKDYVVDYANLLESGETISTSTWSAEGVTVDSNSNTPTTTTAVVSQTNGEIKNTVVTTGGSVARTLIKRIRFRETPAANTRQKW